MVAAGHAIASLQDPINVLRTITALTISNTRLAVSTSGVQLRLYLITFLIVAAATAWGFRYEPITPGNEWVWDRWLHQRCLSETVSQGWGCRGERIPKASDADKLREKLRAAGFSDKETNDYPKGHPDAKP